MLKIEAGGGQANNSVMKTWHTGTPPGETSPRIIDTDGD